MVQIREAIAPRMSSFVFKARKNEKDQNIRNVMKEAKIGYERFEQGMTVSVSYLNTHSGARKIGIWVNVIRE